MTGSPRGHLFTSESATAAAEKSAIVRRERADARRKRAENARTELEDLRALAEALEGVRGSVRPVVFAAAANLAERILTGDVPLSQVHHAATAVEKLVAVGRLESGEATSQSLSITAGPEAFRDWVTNMREQLSPSAPPGDTATESTPTAVDV